MKIAYLGHDFFADCLADLLTAQHETIGLYTNQGGGKHSSHRRIIELSAGRNIPVHFGRFGEADALRLRAQGCELLISAGYPHKIPTAALAGMMAINIHPTLLPVGRGPWPLPEVILRGLPRSGVTLHKLTERYDGGDIVMQAEFEVEDAEDLEMLCCKSQMLARKLMAAFMKCPQRLWDAARPQGPGAYWNYPEFEERGLDFSQPLATVLRQARAYGNAECFAVVGDRRWTVQSASGWAEPHSHAAGTLVHRTHHELLVAAADGYVCLRPVLPLA